MKQLRLLVVMDGFFVGGTETHLLATIPDLIDEGAHVVVVGADGPLVQTFEDLGCAVHKIEFPLEDSVLESTWRDIEARLSTIINDANINVIHGHHVPSTRFVVRIASNRQIPMFFTIHGTYYELSSLHSVLKHCANTISVSSSIHDWLMDNDIPSLVIPNGIKMEQFKPLDKDLARLGYKLSSTQPVIVYASRLAREKADICIRLMDASHFVRKEFFPDLQVIIAGDGIGHRAIAMYAEFLNATQREPFITCLGEQLNMNRIFAVADCVVGTGRVALEAMACERAVIAAGCKGMVGIVKPENYETALKYHFGDHKADRPVTEASLATAIADILASSEARVTLGVQGRQLVDSKLNIHNIAPQLMTLYQNALNPNPANSLVKRG